MPTSPLDLQPWLGTRPSIDAGILMIDRIEPPWVDPCKRRAYQAWVARVFQGRGNDLVAILTRQRVDPSVARRVVRQCTSAGGRRPLPRDLTRLAWIEAYESTSFASGR